MVQRATGITQGDGPPELFTSAGLTWRRRRAREGSKWRLVRGESDGCAARSEVQRIADLFAQTDTAWDQDWRERFGTEPPSGGVDLSEFLPIRGRPAGPSDARDIAERRRKVASLRADGLTIEAIAEKVHADRRTVDRDLATLRRLR